MIYYHGTDRYFKVLQFPTQRAYKDFGYGIYFADTEIHARRVAYWKGGISAYVYAYKVNITEIKKIFNVKEFRGPSVEWLKYVIANRTRYLPYDYDLVIGPTADRSAQSMIQDFIRKYDSPSLGDFMDLKKRLKVEEYGNQICVKSQALLDIFNRSRIKGG